jgi:hypothetical protein
MQVSYFWLAVAGLMTACRMYGLKPVAADRRMPIEYPPLGMELQIVPEHTTLERTFVLIIILKNESDHELSLPKDMHLFNHLRWRLFDEKGDEVLIPQILVEATPPSDVVNLQPGESHTWTLTSKPSDLFISRSGRYRIEMNYGYVDYFGLGLWEGLATASPVTCVID